MPSNMLDRAQVSIPGELIVLTTNCEIAIRLTFGQATATSLLFAARAASGAIGNAVFTGIFSSRFAASMPPAVAAAVIPLGLSPSELPVFIPALAAGNVPA